MSPEIITDVDSDTMSSDSEGVSDQSSVRYAGDFRDSSLQDLQERLFAEPAHSKATIIIGLLDYGIILTLFVIPTRTHVAIHSDLSYSVTIYPDICIIWVMTLKCMFFFPSFYFHLKWLNALYHIHV